MAGLELVESFPGTMAIIASRAPGGGISIAMAEGLKARFHRIDFQAPLSRAA